MRRGRRQRRAGQAAGGNKNPSGAASAQIAANSGGALPRSWLNASWRSQCASPCSTRSWQATGSIGTGRSHEVVGSLTGVVDERLDDFTSSPTWESAAASDGSPACSDGGACGNEPATTDKKRAMIQGIIAGRTSRVAGARMLVSNRRIRRQPVCGFNDEKFVSWWHKVNRIILASNMIGTTDRLVTFPPNGNHIRNWKMRLAPHAASHLARCACSGLFVTSRHAGAERVASRRKPGYRRRG